VGRAKLNGRVVLHSVLCAVVSGCGAQSPTTPDRSAPPPTMSFPAGSDDGFAGSVAALTGVAEASAPAVVQGTARTSYTLVLLKGTMSLTLSDGTTNWGTYHGTATQQRHRRA
jgi:hypothetical protein